MAGRRFRLLGFGLLATFGAGLLGLTAMMNSAFAFGEDVTLVDSVTQQFVTPIFPDFTAASAQSAFTPEGFYPTDPLTGVNSLPAGPSEAQGLTIMNADIDPQIAAGAQQILEGEYAPVAALAPPLSVPSDPLAVPSPDLPAEAVNDPTSLADVLSSLAALYGAALASTVANAVTLFVGLPLLNISLFVGQLAQGNLVNAIVEPLTVSAGLIAQLAAAQVDLVVVTASQTISDIASLFP